MNLLSRCVNITRVILLTTTHAYYNFIADPKPPAGRVPAREKDVGGHYVQYALEHRYIYAGLMKVQIGF